LIYYIAPLVILLSLNLLFFGMTAWQLWTLRRDSRRVFRGANSKIHGPAGQRKQDKEQFAMYAKLFLLMGVTWIMEVVSWAIGGDESLWYFTDSVNYLRGVLIFWFCVWSKKNMRKVFLEKFCSCCSRLKKKKQQPVADADLPSSRNTSRTSTVSAASTTI
jgi:G protein-coupled receptor Mth (Methuselah protein)